MKGSPLQLSMLENSDIAALDSLQQLSHEQTDDTEDKGFERTTAANSIKDGRLLPVVQLVPSTNPKAPPTSIPGRQNWRVCAARLVTDMTRWTADGRRGRTRPQER